MATISNPGAADHGQGDESEQGMRKNVGTLSRLHKEPSRTRQTIAPTQRAEGAQHPQRSKAGRGVGRTVGVHRRSLTVRDDRIVEEREHPRVQFLDVGVERLDEVGRQASPPDAPSVCSRSSRRHRRPVLDRAPCVKPLASDQIPQRLGMQRPDVRDVADEALEERDPARRVERLEHERRAGPKLVVRELEEPQQVARLQMLDDLRGEQPAERSVGQRREVADDVGFGDVEPAARQTSTIS